jgi:tetratricopeptide (TPR) repeat protein
MNFSTGEKLISQKEFRKALDIFLELKKNNNKDEILFYLGLIYFQLNNFDKSIFYYKKFLKKKPDSIIALYNFAFVKQSMGDIETAKNIYLKLIELDLNKIRPYYGLFTLNPKNLNDKDFETILNIKKNYTQSPFEKGIIDFLLSKKEKKNKNYSKEIQYLENSHSLIFNSKKIFNVQSQFYYNKIISQHFDQIKFFGNKNEFENNEITPIFIIGLPRSGSTLIEAIVSSSLEPTNSMGECHVINMSIFEQIGKKIYAKNFDYKNFNFEIDLKVLNDSVTRRYDQFDFLDKKNLIIIDKSLENFFNIEAILNVLPKAKFIHTFRNPLDSIISIYQSMLSDLSWSHSIHDITNYLDNYIRTINYFKKKYPKVIMDVDLEKFTRNSKDISKEIYKFCNLEWTDDILDFYKRDNLHSKTLSFAQIRNKVSSYNETKYKPYFYLLEKYKKNFNWLNV